MTTWKVYESLKLEKGKLFGYWRSWTCMEGMVPLKASSREPDELSPQLRRQYEKTKNEGLILFVLNTEQFFKVSRALKQLERFKIGEWKPNEFQQEMIDDFGFSESEFQNIDDKNISLERYRNELREVDRDLTAWFTQNGFEPPDIDNQPLDGIVVSTTPKPEVRVAPVKYVAKHFREVDSLSKTLKVGAAIQKVAEKYDFSIEGFKQQYYNRWYSKKK